MKTRPPLLLLIIIEITVLFMFFIITDVVPDVRGGFGSWRWLYDAVHPNKGAILIGAVLIYASVALLLLYRKRTSLILLWAWFGAATLPYIVMYLRYDQVMAEMLSRTLSGLSTGPHLAAAELDWNLDLLRNWPDTMVSIAENNRHVALSPPGAPLIYVALNALFRTMPEVSSQLQQLLLPYHCHNFALLAYAPEEWASAIVGMLMPVWSAFGVLPLYSSTRRLLSQSQARWAVIWWPLVPGIAKFAPTFNTIYPVFSLIAFDLVTRWQRNPTQRAWLGIAGLMLGLATFTYLGFVPLLLFAGLYISFILITQYGLDIPTLLKKGTPIAIWLSGGIALPWLCYWLISQVTPLDILRTSMTLHLALSVPYLPWLWMHLQDWIVFTGIPLSIVWIAAAIRRTNVPFERRGWILGVTLLVTMLVVDISGTARAETGRVWLLYSPFVLIAASDGLYRLFDKHNHFRTGAVLTACQVGMFLALAMFWKVLISDLSARPSPPGNIPTTHHIEAHFGDMFVLTGWDTQKTEQGILLNLSWQAEQPMTVPYWFQATLIDSNGNPIGNSVAWQPLNASYPTTCWVPGEEIGDTILLPLPAEIEPGSWQIMLVSLANLDFPEDSLPISLDDGQRISTLFLGPVDVSK
ncbi:MAG: hypothetical protein Kow0077_23420 [Anaerolineae bacterium]